MQRVVGWRSLLCLELGAAVTTEVSNKGGHR